MALINIGTSPNDGTGDKLRDAFDKINTADDLSAKLNKSNTFTEFQNSFIDLNLGNNTSGYAGCLGAKRLSGNNDTDLKYTTYLAYDVYFDYTNNNWVAYRSTLGRKQIMLMGYQDDGFKFLSVDAANATYKTSDFTKIMHIVGSTKSVAIGDILPTEKLEVDGNVKATSFITSSDERLKQNITKLEKGIKGLKPVAFNFKNGDKTNHYGFIAQDLIKTHPELVRGSGKKREDGTIDYFSIKQMDIIALLVKDAQDKDKEIDDLKNRIEKLEKIISKLI